MSIYDGLVTGKPASSSARSTIYDTLASSQAAPAPKPTIFSSIAGGIKTVASDIRQSTQDYSAPAPYNGNADLLTPGGRLPSTLSPHALGADFVHNLKTSFLDAFEKIGTSVGVFNNPETGAVQKAAAVPAITLQFANVLFSPITSALRTASSIPVAGKLADGVNILFNAIGTGGADAAEGAVEALPISQSAKETIMPIAKDAGALAAQLIVGKAGGDVAGRYAAKTADVAGKVKEAVDDHPELRKLSVQSETPGETPVDITTPTTKHADYAQSQGYEPYPKTEDLPVIDAGKGAKPDLPVFQTEPRAVPKVPGDFTFEPVPPQRPAVVPTTQVSAPHIQESTVLPPDVPKAPTPTVKEPAPTLPKPLRTEPGISRVGKSIEAKAIEANLTRGFKETAGYDTITIKDQAKRAADLVNASPEDAAAVVRGEKPLPDGLRGTSLISAMEEHLLKNPDPQLAYDLANSPLVSETSRFAQEMRLLAERVPDSLTARYKEIKAAREKALEKRGGIKKATKQAATEIKREITKSAAKRETWEEFVQKLTCNV